jgi:hypothetical protein
MAHVDFEAVDEQPREQPIRGADLTHVVPTSPRTHVRCEAGERDARMLSDDC